MLGDRDTQRNRKADRQTKRHTQRERQRERQKDRDKETQREQEEEGFPVSSLIVPHTLIAFLISELEVRPETSPSIS